MMEPSLTPTRIGTPRSLQASMTLATWSRSAMLPGFRRILWTPASSASRARWKWKWTSATIGTRVWLMISRERRGVLLLGDGDADDVGARRG